MQTSVEQTALGQKYAFVNTLLHEQHVTAIFLILAHLRSCI